MASPERATHPNPPERAGVAAHPAPGEQKWRQEDLETPLALGSSISLGRPSTGERVDRRTTEGHSPHTPQSPASLGSAALTAIEGYRIISNLGEGSSSYVFLAQDKRRGYPVALKILRWKDPEAANNPGFTRFQREARILQSMTHPRIVRLLDVGTSQSYHYLALELVMGSDLGRLLRVVHRLEEVVAIKLAADIMEVLELVHGRGIVHRDLKPGNILISRDGELKVSDFGIAKIALPPGKDNQTYGLQFLGTPLYAAPEQIIDPSQVTYRTDFYALGVLLFEMLAGRPPFLGETRGEIERLHLKSAPAMLRRMNPMVSAPMEGLVSHLLEKEPHKRPQDHEQILGWLKQCQSACTERGSDTTQPPELRRRR